MEARARTSDDVVVRLVPGGEYGLAHLSDAELLANTRRLVGKSNQLFAALLLHLAEVEARGIHRTRLCASLYTYCIYELRFSEDAAARRSSAARWVKQFPILFDAVAYGELHLTGLLMLGPLLTAENHVEVLGRAKFRTKKEIGKLVRELNPLPQVPDLIEPLGPPPARLIFNPSWERYAESLGPAVRELPPGERPRDWANDADAHETSAADGKELGGSRADEGARNHEEVLPVGPAPADLLPITGPQQYQMQFTTVEQHAELVDRAKALLAKTKPGVSLGDLHFEAMKLYVAALEKRRFAVNEPPPSAVKSPSPAPRQRVVDAGELAREVPNDRILPASPRTRQIPAAEKRAVFQRDRGRCTYTNDSGARCHETHYLELHHLAPFAHGGPNTASNLCLRCAAHNALAAEQDFGRAFIAKKRDWLRHEPRCRQNEQG